MLVTIITRHVQVYGLGDFDDKNLILSFVYVMDGVCHKDEGCKMKLRKLDVIDHCANAETSR